MVFWVIPISPYLHTVIPPLNLRQEHCANMNERSISRVKKLQNYDIVRFSRHAVGLGCCDDDFVQTIPPNTAAAQSFCMAHQDWEIVELRWLLGLFTTSSCMCSRKLCCQCVSWTENCMNLEPECMHVRLTSVEMGKLHIEKFLPRRFFCKELYIGRKAFETTRMQIQIRAFLFGCRRRRCRSYRWWLLFFRFHTNAGRGRRACLNKKFFPVRWRRKY